MNLQACSCLVATLPRVGLPPQKYLVTVLTLSLVKDSFPKGKTFAALAGRLWRDHTRVLRGLPPQRSEGVSVKVRRGGSRSDVGSPSLL